MEGLLANIGTFSAFSTSMFGKKSRNKSQQVRSYLILLVTKKKTYLVQISSAEVVFFLQRM
jgi:hypothetical protein